MDFAHLYVPYLKELKGTAINSYHCKALGNLKSRLSEPYDYAESLSSSLTALKNHPILST